MNMNKNFYLLLLALLFSFPVKSQETFNGRSVAQFEASKTAIRSRLNEKEQQKFDVALRVLAISVIYDQEHGILSKKQKFDDVVIKRLNGKGLPEAYEMATKFIQADHQRNIEQLEKQVRVLEQEKEKSDLLTAQLNVLTAKPVNITQQQGQLTITAAFTNTGNQPLSTYGIVLAFHSAGDETDGWSCTKGYDGNAVIAPGETRMISCSCPFEEAKESAVNVKWDQMKFPVTDFKANNLVLKCYTSRVVLNGKEYVSGNGGLSEKELLDLKEKQEALYKAKANVPVLADLVPANK